MIAIAGELDRFTVDGLEKRLAGHLGAGTDCLLLHLEACSFIDSAGIAAILYYLRDMAPQARLGAVAPNPNVDRLLRTVGTYGDPRFSSFADTAGALAALAG